jgi:hypothetical protein
VTAVAEAKRWFAQAASDIRTATALLAAPVPMLEADVGCHTAAMCAQAIEKSIKGYMILNRATPSLDHRPDKYLPSLLTKNDPLLRYRAHHRHLSALFDPSTKDIVKHLLDLTPGARGNRTDVPNTEYPWKVAGVWTHTPAGAAELDDSNKLALWLRVSKRVCDTLNKLLIATEQGAVL